MASTNYSTFHIVSLQDFCWEVQSPDDFFNPAANNLFLRVYPSEQFDCTPPENLGDDDASELFRNTTVEPGYGLSRTADEVFIATISDARLATDNAFLFSRHGLMFAESHHGLDWVRLPMERTKGLVPVDFRFAVDGEDVQVPINLARMNDNPPVIDETAILLAAPWWMGYHHWIMEVLPRLWVLDEFAQLRDLPFVVPAGVKDYHLAPLKLLGIDESRLIKFDGDTLDFKRLYVPSFLAPGAYSMRQCTWLKDKFLAACGITSLATGTRRYLLSRRDVGNRDIANLAELQPVIEKHGLEIISPGDMSIEDQVAAFADAEIVVSPHSAGIINTVFAPEDCTLVEIMTPSYINPANWYISTLLGHPYYFLIGEAAGDASVSGEHDNMTIDPAQLDLILTQALG